MKNLKIITVISLLVPSMALAVPQTVGQITGRLDFVAKSLFDIAMVVGIVCVLWSAFQYMTAGGDSEKVGNANKTMLYAVIGLAAVLIASGVPKLIESIIGS